MAPFMHEAVAHRSKRVRFSNEPSPPPSALASTDAADDKTTKVVDEDTTSDSDSTLSESSEEPSSESSSEEEDDDDDDDDSDNDNDNGKDTEMALDEPTGPDGVVNLRANRGKKPIMKLTPEEMGPDIRGFLKDFLPKLKAANEELIAQKKAGTLRSLDAGDQDEGEPYIEMDLGLGVLEEKDPNANSDTDSASDADDDDTAEKDVLGRLMGRQKKQDPAGIEVLQNNTSS